MLFLLNELSNALKAFMDDLKSSKLDEQVMVLVFSEFGRRVKENDSLGTDHGTAGPVFLAGSSISKGVLGKTPSLLELDDGDLKYTTDFRQIYASVVADWLTLRLPESLVPFHVPDWSGITNKS